MNTLRTYVRTYDSLHDTYARVLFMALIGVCVGLMMIYGYLLKSAAFSAALWEDIGSEIPTLSGEVSDLETGYLARIGTLGLEEAHMLGLMETKRVTFVERDSSRVDTVSLAGGVARTETR